MSLAALAQEHRASASDPAARQGPSTSGATPTGFAMLTRFIPTETITLYVAAIAVQESLAELKPFGLPIDRWVIYWTFALLTPALLLILLSNALATQPATAKPLHWWPFVASLLAFLVWGLSVPGMIDSDALQAVCAFGALFLSTLLSLVEPIIPPRAT